jgi:CheY-like chemotaxis protein
MMSERAMAPSVFILDDNTDVLAFVDLALGSGNFEVETFSRPAVFLERLAARRPDVILVDIRMPGMSGHQVVREIRARETNIPIIVISASEKQEDAIEAMRLGAFDFLRKPLRDFVLVNAIRHALKSRALNTPPAVPVSAQAQPTRDDRVLDVLLADDCESNRLLIAAYLRGTPYRLVQTESGAEALARFEAESFHVVLMDMKMPDLDGLTATRRLREIEKRLGRRRTPVIAVTAHALPEHVRESLSAGCDAHLTKPIMRETLLAQIFEHTKSIPAPRARVSVPTAEIIGAGPALAAPESATTESPSPAAVPDYLISLQPHYIESRRQDLKLLQDALAAGDLGATREIGHKIRGTGASYGFEKLTKLGAEIERGSEAGDAATVRRALEEFAAFLSQCPDRRMSRTAGRNTRDAADRNAPADLLHDPIPITKAALRERWPAETSLDAALAGVEGYLLVGTSYDVDPADRRRGDGRQFFSDAFRAISLIRADGIHPGRVDRIQAVIANVFTPGTGFIACLVAARSYLRTVWDEQETLEGPLVIGIHDFHYGAGNADWSGELGSLRLPWRPPPRQARVWRGDEERGFAAVYGRDLGGFAAGMKLSGS